MNGGNEKDDWKWEQGGNGKRKNEKKEVDKDRKRKKEGGWMISEKKEQLTPL